MNRRECLLVLKNTVQEFNVWSKEYLSGIEKATKITVPLYHYTNAAGLEGLIKAQQVWFTNYRHLNDPSELTYGMSIASEMLKEASLKVDKKLKLFCDVVMDFFTHKSLVGSLDFFIASFSKERNDLGQWRAYGDDGKGFALGLAPHLFHVIDKSDTEPHENVFVTPVVYGEQAGRDRHHVAIEKSLTLVSAAIDRAADIMHDMRVGLPFFQNMARELIASQLIWNSLTIKHQAYEHEQEVRLIIVGLAKSLNPYISTRTRGSEIVPFIKSDMAIQDKGCIAEIVIGPSAAPTAENGLKALLSPFHGDPEAIMKRSDIPYCGR